jgi:hypothetical protein
MAAGPAQTKRPSLRDGAFFLGTRLRMHARLVRNIVLGALCRGFVVLEDRGSGAFACSQGLIGTRF